MDTEWVRQNCTKIEYLCQSHSAVSLLPLDYVLDLKRNRKLDNTICKRSHGTSYCFERTLFVKSSQPLFHPIEMQLKVKLVEVKDRRIQIVYYILRRG